MNKKAVYRKTLVGQFAEVLAHVQKIERVKGDGMTYLRILDIANALRDELLSRGLLLVPNDREWWFDVYIEPDGHVKTAEHGSLLLCELCGRQYRVITQCGVKTEFELTDGRSSRRWVSFGMGQDSDGFAM